MIYAQNIETEQFITIPKNGAVVAGGMSFKMENTTDLTSVTLSVTDITFSDLYFLISVTLPANTTSGEYKYTLSKGSAILSTGLLVIGEGEAPSEYNKTIVYEQYGN